MTQSWQVLDCASVSEAIFKRGALVAEVATLIEARQTAGNYIEENYGQLSLVLAMVTDDDEWDGVSLKYHSVDNQARYVRISPLAEILTRD